MIKHLLLLLILSLLIIVGMPYAQQAMHFLLEGHNWISRELAIVFSKDEVGNIARQFLALLAIPVLVGLFFALIYYVFRRSWLQSFMSIVWIIWLLQAGALIMATKV